MKYVAKTYDSEGSIIEVTIGKETDTAITEIGSGGLYLAASEAVTITGETNDPFDTLLPQSASLHFVTDRFLPDFYQGDCRNAPVRIKVGGSTIWRGYVSPMNYTQQWCTAADDLTVNCIDWAAALQFVKYGDCGVSKTYEELLEQSGDRSLKSILEECIALMTDMPVNYRGVPLMSAGSQTALAGLCVNDRLFLGDSREDVWTAQEVVSEILRYLNLHATQRNGVIEVYPWEEVQKAAPLAIGAGNVYGDDHSISMTEMYNRISVKADMEDAEDFIPSMLDDELLQSRFGKLQPYCTEHSLIANSKGKYNDMIDNYIRSFVSTETGTGYVGSSEKGARITTRKWYLRAMNAPGWKCYGEGTRWDGTLPLNRDSCLYDGQFEGGTNHWPGTWSATTYQNSRLDMLIPSRGATIVTLANEDISLDDEDNSVRNDRQSETVLTFGVGGAFIEGNRPTADHVANLRDSLRKAVPRMSYQGSSTDLSPVDDETTRYIVIKGKIGLAPVVNKGCYGDFLKQCALNAVANGNFIDYRTYFQNEMKSGSDGKRYFNRYYYTCQTPDSTPQNNVFCNGDHNVNTGTDISVPRLFTPISDEIGQYFKFERSRKTDGSMTKLDYVSKVGVLSCMLIVGDKCVVESGDGLHPSDYRWKTFKKRSQCNNDDEFFAQSFTIGFNPKLGDYILGKKYDIINTITPSMGIEGTGIAIPVRKSDGVKGEVTFLILGPNVCIWDDGSLSWFQRLLNSYLGIDSGVDLLSYVSHIDLSDFEVKVASDNGGDDPLNDSDLVYVSDTDETYFNEKDDIEMKLCSALTAAERKMFGTRDVRSLSTVKEISTGLGVLAVKDPRTGETGKPEQFYVDRAWRDSHTPKLEIEHGVRTSRISADMLSTYSHQAMAGKKFWPLAITRDLQTNSATIRLRQI